MSEARFGHPVWRIICFPLGILSEFQRFVPGGPDQVPGFRVNGGENIVDPAYQEFREETALPRS
ncbi:MAG: hypothetical protein PHI71_05805 [Acidiphilium sp.]|nr:hypothetical protein [Acidiphilium sp.]